MLNGPRHMRKCRSVRAICATFDALATKAIRECHALPIAVTSTAHVMTVVYNEYLGSAVLHCIVYVVAFLSNCAMHRPVNTHGHGLLQ